MPVRLSVRPATGRSCTYRVLYHRVAECNAPLRAPDPPAVDDLARCVATAPPFLVSLSSDLSLSRLSPEPFLGQQTLTADSEGRSLSHPAPPDPTPAAARAEPWSCPGSPRRHTDSSAPPQWQLSRSSSLALPPAIVVGCARPHRRLCRASVSRPGVEPPALAGACTAVSHPLGAMLGTQAPPSCRSLASRALTLLSATSCTRSVFLSTDSCLVCSRSSCGRAGGEQCHASGRHRPGREPCETVRAWRRRPADSARSFSTRARSSFSSSSKSILGCLAGGEVHARLKN